MLYLGMDVHFKRTSICALDENGKELLSREVKGPWPEVIAEVERIRDRSLDRVAVCFEASCASGFLHDRMRKVASRVVVANPSRVRLIFQSKRKNDRIDAKKLATLLFLDQVPSAYIPGYHVRAWRQTIEYRSRLIAKRTRVKNEIRALLRGHGLPSPYKLWNRKGLKWLSGLKFEHGLTELRLAMLLEELLSLHRKVKLVEKALKAEADLRPGVRLLMTIPGVGIRTAEALVAYIDDPNRFRNSKCIGAYFGLVPRLDSSAGHDRLGHITKEGPGTVRRLLVEASWYAIRRSKKIRAYFDRIVKDDPDRHKIGIVATAHYLARVSLAMLRTGECFEEAA